VGSNPIGSLAIREVDAVTLVATELGVKPRSDESFGKRRATGHAHASECPSPQIDLSQQISD